MSRRGGGSSQGGGYFPPVDSFTLNISGNVDWTSTLTLTSGVLPQDYLFRLRMVGPSGAPVYGNPVSYEGGEAGPFEVDATNAVDLVPDWQACVEVYVPATGELVYRSPYLVPAD